MSTIGVLLSVTLFAAANDAATQYTVVDEGSLEPYWMPAEKTRGPQFPRAVFLKGIESCVAIGFAIESDGRTANVSVLRTASNKPGETQAIAQVEAAARQAVAQWRYDPGAENDQRKAVYTYIVVSDVLSSMNASKSVVRKHADDIEHPCHIENFPAAVARGDFAPKEQQTP